MEEKKRDQRKISFNSLLAISFIICIFGFVFFSNFQDSNVTAPKDPISFIKSTLGVPSKGDGGAYFQQGAEDVSFDKKNGIAEVDYRLYPYDDQYNRDISLALVDNIKTLFKSHFFKEIVFNIYLPSTDKYGNISWGYYTSFTITDSLMSKINWDNFNSGNLVGLAQSD